MNILVLNGSPRSNNSNTLKLTDAFIEGIKEASNVEVHNVEIVDSMKVNVNYCRGCFTCMRSKDGKCILDDDMAVILDKYLKADAVIWSFPLYYYSMPANIKVIMDRMLPLAHMKQGVDENGKSYHVERYNLSNKRHVLISTCGFGTWDKNYDALEKQFSIIYGDYYEKILCPEGELLRVPELGYFTNPYIEDVKMAGKEFSYNGKISEETNSKLKRLFVPIDKFIEMANNY